MNTSSYKILGIDVGYARLGVGVIDVDGDKLTHLFHDCLETPAKMEHNERLLILKKELQKIAKKYKPALAVVEDLFFFKNKKTVIRVGEVRGAIIVTLADLKIKILNLTPLEIKQGVTGYGRADKKQVQEMVKLLLKLEKIPKPDDAADALAAAISGSNAINLLN